MYRDNFGQESTLEDCYDYSALQAFLTSFADREQIELLETILAEILDYCFKDQTIAAAEVWLTKPDVFQGAGAPVVSSALTQALLFLFLPIQETNRRLDFEALNGDPLTALGEAHDGVFPVKTA